MESATPPVRLWAGDVHRRPAIRQWVWSNVAHQLFGSVGIVTDRSVVLKSFGAPFSSTTTRAVTVRPWSTNDTSKELESTGARETSGANSINGQSNRVVEIGDQLTDVILLALSIFNRNEVE